MRGNAARALLPGLAVLVLVGVVAVAATGSTPSGSGDARPPADVLLDSLFSLVLVALGVAAAMLVYGLSQRQAIAREIASGRYRRTGLASFLAFMFLFTLVVYFWLPRDWSELIRVEDELGEQAFPGEPPSTPAGDDEIGSTYDPEFTWLPIVVVLALGMLVAVAALLSMRRRLPSSREADAIARAFADVLDDTLDDLRAEGDPRRAVIAAYARLERTLGAQGLPRRAAETAEEYLPRFLHGLDVDERSVRRLTDLFERAKFSQHDVDAGMKEEAIDALVQVRDELRASANAARTGPLPPLRTGEGHA